MFTKRLLTVSGDPLSCHLISKSCLQNHVLEKGSCLRNVSCLATCSWRLHTQDRRHETGSFSNQNEKFHAYEALDAVQVRKILQEILILNAVSCLTLLDTSHVTLFPEPRCSTNAMWQFTPQDSPGRPWGVVIPCAGDFVRQRGLQHDALGSTGEIGQVSFSQVRSSPGGAVRKAITQGSVQAGNHFRFARQKPVQKRHCLLLFSHARVLPSKIHFRNPGVLQQETALRVLFMPGKRVTKRTSLLRVKKRRENLSVSKRSALFWTRCFSGTRILPCGLIRRFGGASLLGSVQARNCFQRSLHLPNRFQKDIAS